MEGTLGQNRVDDVSWLCSLSESELDMLISIKRIVLHRARMIGCDELAQKFDLKVLRALGFSLGKDLYIIYCNCLARRLDSRKDTVNKICAAFVLMECVKDKVKDLTLPESTAFMGSCNLLKHNLGDIMSLEEIMACIGIDSRKGPIKRRPHKETTRNQKRQKTEASEL